MDNIDAAYEFFKDSIIKGKIKSSKDDEESIKVMNHLTNMIYACDNSIHDRSVNAIFEAGFVAGQQHMCRQCNLNKLF